MSQFHDIRGEEGIALRFGDGGDGHGIQTDQGTVGVLRDLEQQLSQLLFELQVVPHLVALDKEEDLVFPRREEGTPDLVPVLLHPALQVFDQKAELGAELLHLFFLKLAGMHRILHGHQEAIPVFRLDENLLLPVSMAEGLGAGCGFVFGRHVYFPGFRGTDAGRGAPDRDPARIQAALPVPVSYRMKRHLQGEA